MPKHLVLKCPRLKVVDWLHVLHSLSSIKVGLQYSYVDIAGWSEAIQYYIYNH